jgi:hypothetical protein
MGTVASGDLSKAWAVASASNRSVGLKLSIPVLREVDGSATIRPVLPAALRVESTRVRMLFKEAFLARSYFVTTIMRGRSNDKHRRRSSPDISISVIGGEVLSLGPRCIVCSAASSSALPADMHKIV